MKRMLAVPVAVLLFFCLTFAVFAEGNGNIDGSGGGDFGQGSAGNYWSGGYEGIRATIVTLSGQQVAGPIDYTNIRDLPNISHFGLYNKLTYLGGQGLTPKKGNYLYKNPSNPLPTIITAGGGNHIAALKQYFTREDFLTMLCDDTGFSYEQLISGQYKVLLEPIAYFYFQGEMVGCTATEAALYDAMTDGLLWKKMNSLTHKNLPLAIFLEHDDLGIPAYSGPTDITFRDNSLILRQLGIGIISFEEDAVEAPNPSGGDYTFRTDTDVILSVYLENTTGEDITPDDNATVDLNIGGRHYHRDFVCPAGERQLIWVKWHTPSTPQKLEITATSAQEPALNKTMTADIVKIEEVPPPDPTYYDKNYGFSLNSIRDFGSNTSAEWSEWYAYRIHEPGLHEHEWYEYVPDHPEWWDYLPSGDYWTNEWPCTENDCDTPEEHSRWEFERNVYSASLNVDFSIKPDDRCVTAYQNGSEWVMKSGYGVQAECSVAVTTGGNADDYDVTPVQNVVALFSEFGFETYNRFLETESSRSNGYRAVWNFKTNEYSFYNGRLHFTPLWYPDNTEYVVQAAVFDCWTPGGQLYTTVSDRIQIYKSCLDDWYIHSVD